jgi:predicted component of type VI protein secretion system
MARIYYYSDDNELMEVEVGSMAPEVVIGRHSTCQIRSAGQSVSRRHARVYLTTGGYWIEDLGSSNGTFVSGERLEPNTPTSLVHETLFACGQFELRLTYDDEDFDLESAGWPDGTATARSALPQMPGGVASAASKHPAAAGLHAAATAGHSRSACQHSTAASAGWAGRGQHRLGLERVAGSRCGRRRRQRNCGAAGDA